MSLRSQFDLVSDAGLPVIMFLRCLRVDVSLSGNLNNLKKSRKSRGMSQDTLLRVVRKNLSFNYFKIRLWI